MLLDDRAPPPGFDPRNLGADKGYDTQECLHTLRSRGLRRA
jgi:hypothetical protein